MRNRSRYYIFWAGMHFTVLMSFFLWYANHPSKAKVKGVELRKSKDLILHPVSAKAKKPIAAIDSNPTNLPGESSDDTVSRKILLIGDSQVEGLRVPFYDYCIKNKHTLLLAATWYSSTDMLFASNDTLKNIIARYKPDYIVMVIGLNQIYTTSLEPCEVAVKKILTTFNGIPYTWIGPANWTEDKGINNIYQENVDKGCFFLSKDLVLPRANDGRHPSELGNKIWMDSIGSWLNNKAHWRLRMHVPDSIVKNKNINDWTQLAK